MLANFNILNHLIIIFLYFFIYNITLIGFFWLLFKFINVKTKTLYSFSNFKLNFFSIITLSVCLFSMAGIPPFIGFFSKLLILISLLNSSFFPFFPFFFILLFLGLYFYLQNLKHIHTYHNSPRLTYFHLFFLHNTHAYYYYTVLLLIFLFCGFFFIDDLLMLFAWFIF